MSNGDNRKIEVVSSTQEMNLERLIEYWCKR